MGSARTVATTQGAAYYGLPVGTALGQLQSSTPTPGVGLVSSSSLEKATAVTQEQVLGAMTSAALVQMCALLRETQTNDTLQQVLSDGLESKVLSELSSRGFNVSGGRIDTPQGGKIGLASQVDMQRVLLLAAAMKSGSPTAAYRAKALAKGNALPPAAGQPKGAARFPINNRGDLGKAIHMCQLSKNPVMARRWCMTRARALGAMDMIPDNWNSDGTLETGS